MGGDIESREELIVNTPEKFSALTAHGTPLTKVFTSEEEVMNVVEKAVLLFRDEGISGERFADTVNRLGFDYVNDKLINGDIDKKAILNKTVKGGANC